MSNVIGIKLAIRIFLRNRFHLFPVRKVKNNGMPPAVNFHKLPELPEVYLPCL